MPDDKSDDDYEVGYGKPPKHTRFKRGKSGNPMGRPRKEPENLPGVVEKVMKKQVVLRENGEIKEMSLLEAAITSALTALAAGKPAAFKALLPIIAPHMGPSSAIGTSTVSAEDARKKLLDRILRMNVDEPEPGGDDT